jgi:hypothetical protein
MKRLIAGLALLAALALLASACGGGSSRSKAYAGSKADYAAALDTICAATNEAGKSLSLSSVSDIAENGDQGKKLLDDLVDKVRSLEAPPEVQDSADSFADGLQKEADSFGDLVAAAKDGDTAKVQQIQGELQSETAATSEDARFIGATGCARLLG